MSDDCCWPVREGAGAGGAEELGGEVEGAGVQGPGADLECVTPLLPAVPVLLFPAITAAPEAPPP